MQDLQALNARLLQHAQEAKEERRAREAAEKAKKAAEKSAEILATRVRGLQEKDAELREALEEPERELIRRALEHFDGNRQRTAESLGINRSTLFTKMRRLGIR